MLYDNSVCSVDTNRLVLFREIMSVCCGNCRIVEGRILGQAPSRRRKGGVGQF
jgi:hypothetical protein